MSTAARAWIAIAAITAAALAVGWALDALIRVAPLHGTGDIALHLSIAAVIPIWAAGVRAVAGHAIRTSAAERATL